MDMKAINNKLNQFEESFPKVFQKEVVWTEILSLFEARLGYEEMDYTEKFLWDGPLELKVEIFKAIAERANGKVVGTTTEAQKAKPGLLKKTKKKARAKNAAKL